MSYSCGINCSATTQSASKQKNIIKFPNTIYKDKISTLTSNPDNEWRWKVFLETNWTIFEWSVWLDFAICEINLSILLTATTTWPNNGRSICSTTVTSVYCSVERTSTKQFNHSTEAIVTNEILGRNKTPEIKPSLRKARQGYEDYFSIRQTSLYVCVERMLFCFSW